jgi:hypothetical protein
MKTYELPRLVQPDKTMTSHASSAMLNDHLDRRSTDCRSVTGERIPEQPQLPLWRERRRSQRKAVTVDTSVRLLFDIAKVKQSGID